MTYDEVMSRLESLGDERLRQQNARHGVGENQFGVKMGDLRAIAKEIKLNPALANELWESGNFEAMLLSMLLMKPKQLTTDDLERMVRGIPHANVADWFSSYILKQNPQKESLRERWMNSDHEMTARLGWSLTAERIVKEPTGLDLTALLDRLDREMPGAPSVVQWTMNFSLGEIGIHFPEHRDRVVAMGERIGAFRDYPTSKGCTSPFVPLWVAEMVRRQG